MVEIAVTCLRSFLKLVNCVMGMVGIAMILYGLWLLRAWQREIQNTSPFHDFTSISPWFACTSLGSGAVLCVITCLGHIATNSRNGCCLSCYMLIIILILLLEGAVTADILLNSNWEKDLPEDPTGKLDDLKHFVKSNFEICKLVGLVIISSQGLSILLAMALKAVIQNHGPNYDSEYDYGPARLPLIKHDAQPPQFSSGKLKNACQIFHPSSRNFSYHYGKEAVTSAQGQ
ncbi:hypothetical protein L6164_036650 [Bauhinia variegata]|uniref:Uncharacterized protein n=1 Tax=Bauhinia variegata TaxID=167791 RepID=A0ACB9KHP3_BAUVA|nr:hypothetical protein L6164_036650 [Bauhinia variegata]